MTVQGLTCPEAQGQPAILDAGSGMQARACRHAPPSCCKVARHAAVQTHGTDTNWCL